jgi:hypothetical protein
MRKEIQPNKEKTLQQKPVNKEHKMEAIKKQMSKEKHQCKHNKVLEKKKIVKMAGKTQIMNKVAVEIRPHRKKEILARKKEMKINQAKEMMQVQKRKRPHLICTRSTLMLLIPCLSRVSWLKIQHLLSFKTGKLYQYSPRLELPQSQFQLSKRQKSQKHHKLSQQRRLLVDGIE